MQDAVRRERQLTQPRNFGSGKASDEVWKNQGQDIYLSSTCGNAQWTSMNWFFLWQIQDNYTGHSLLECFLKETASRIIFWKSWSFRCFTVPRFGKDSCVIEYKHLKHGTELIHGLGERSIRKVTDDWSLRAPMFLLNLLTIKLYVVNYQTLPNYMWTIMKQWLTIMNH